IGFGGICIIFYEHLGGSLRPEFLFGVSISVTAAWGWAWGTIVMKRVAHSLDAYFSLGLQMCVGGAGLLAVFYGAGIAIASVAVPWQSWLSIAYLIIFGSVITFFAFVYSLQRLSVEQMSIYAYINPIVAVMLGSLFFGEKLTPFIAIGGAVTLYGVYMINRAL